MNPRTRTNRMNLRPILPIAIAAILAVAVGSLYFYKGIYIAPPSEFDFNVSIPLTKPHSFTDAYTSGEGLVLLDKSHDNNFEESEVAALLQRIIVRGQEIKPFSNASRMGEQLRKAVAFVVISPRKEFSAEENTMIGNFVAKGGKLLLIADPEREQVINSLALSLGIFFEENYLYNLQENDGNFRYIQIDNFAENQLTQKLSKITLYVACPVFPAENGIVFTDSNTFSSGTPLVKGFTPIIMKNTALAICDQTFFMEPYNSFTDNNQLISNIADWLMSTPPENNATENNQTKDND